ncbi:MAG: PEP/pyruvate-binding domain-containing protein [Vicinamibacterales bacterium]
MTPTATASPIVDLADATDVARCGGKATNLSRLMRTGVPVPEGLVITSDGIVADPREHEAIWTGLGFTTAIVRSSAVGEDSSNASFAGQLDSVAGVTSATALGAAIQRVRDSQRSDRVLAYQVARGITLAGIGIIIQRQVHAAVSGVLFTAAPGDPTRMLLEYCDGMGEALVSGAINPGRVSIERSAARDLDGHTWSLLAPPEDPAPNEELLLNGPRIAELTSLALEIERTFGCPQDIEWTVDREGKLWIVQSRPITATAPAQKDSGEVGSREGPRVRWSNANVNENFPQPISPLLYSIARQGYYHYFRNLGRSFGVSRRRLERMEPSLRQIIGVHGARIYYNLTSIHSVLRSVPFGGLLAGSFNQFVGAEDTSAAGVPRDGRARQGLELLVIAAKTTCQYAAVTSRVERFEATVDAYAAATEPGHLAQKPLPPLLADFRAFMRIRCSQWNDAALADAGAMVCYGVLQRLLARAFPGRDQQALHNSLLKALPDLVSGVPPLKLWDLSRMVRANQDLLDLFQSATSDVILEEVSSNPQFSGFRDALRQFLDGWGYRCSGELMLTVASFQEQPAPVIDLLKSYLAIDGGSPHDVLRREAEDRIRTTTSILATLRRRSVSPFLPFIRQSLVVGTILEWTQKSIQLRERARLKQALLYSRLRHVVLQIGDRLATAGLVGDPGDIFFLSSEELELVAAGGEMFPHHIKPLIALRRRAHAEVSQTTPPDSLELGVGEYVPAHGSPEGLRYENPGSCKGLDDESARDESELRGVGACGGSTTARAAILMDVTESRNLRRGDVLVTKQTDPGWGPIFPLISGLVIERGGMLSHGAIIAREFGIPSVVGVKDATRRIQPGSTVTVDGDRGVVLLARLT